MRAALAAFVVLVTAAWARQQPPTFRTNTNVVQVDVRVFQGDQFVTGLGLDDFVVTEDGVPQKIESVVLIGGLQGPAAGSQLPASGSQLPASSSQLPAASSQVAGTPAVWLFVFDTPHLSPASLQHTREAVLQFLDTQWHQGDVGGVVFDGKMANNRLTSDRAELRADVADIKMPGNQRSVQIDMTRDWPRFQDEYEVLKIAVDNDRDTLGMVVMRACNDDPDACKRAQPDAEVMGKAERLASQIQQSSGSTLAAVVALANGLARMAGPKTVVFLSEGFVAEKMESQIRNAVGDAARAGAHFYTIDARGLDHGSASSSIIDQPVVESIVGRTTHFDALADGTNSLAVDTGGFAIRNENNMGRALDEIARDAATYYVIGYSPTNSSYDGKYRSIDVKVKRAGVKVRARRGYLALAPAMLLTPKPAVGAKGAEGAKGANGARAEGAKGANGAGAEGAGGAGGESAGVVPDVPVIAGVGPLMPGAPLDGASAAAANAVRARVEAGVLSLKKIDGSDIGAGYAERGWSAYERGALETAVKELSTAAATDRRPWVLYVLGYAQFALRKYQDAANAWTRVRTAVPQFEPVYFDLADALSLQGDETGAIKVLRDAEKRWANDAEIADAVGVIEVRRSALNAAIDSFDRATKLAPADPVGYFNLGRAYQMRFNQSQRYDPAMEKWIGNDDDRDRAIAAYTKYIDLHGPYEQQAQEARAMLQWKK